MALMNFLPDLGPKVKGNSRPVVPTTAPDVEVQEVSSDVQVVTQRSTSRTDLMKPQEQWGWSEVRDYVVAEIEDRFGVFPRDAKKEHGIFTRFCREYGEDAGAIARYAFEVCGGIWKGSPVSVTRFCKGSDVYFSRIIVQRLREMEKP